jgi:hypothetical protein
MLPQLFSETNPQKRGKTSAEIPTFALSWKKLNGKQQISLSQAAIFGVLFCQSCECNTT